MSTAIDGAMERAFEQTVVALSRHDVAQRVVIGSNSDSMVRLKSAGLEPMELPFRPRFDFSSKRRLNSEINAFGAELVISWTPDVSSQVIQGSAHHIGYVTNDFPSAKYQTCNHLFALSQKRVDRAVAAGWSKDKITLLPQVIKSEAISAIDRKTFFTPDTAKLVVVVGNLVMEQGLDVLMESIARISGHYLWVVGDGPDRKQFEERALSIGIKPRTRFVGVQGDAMSLVAAADIVVCPARQDDIGEQVLQAWACAKPIIAADSLGPGLLIKHRENGVLVPVDDSRSLAEAIKWLNQDTDFAQRIAAAGLATFSDSHSELTVIPDYLAFLQNAVAGGAESQSDQ
ncbi:MAG: glycosyltransferase family 4 protein [Rhodospirillaceae bacterium]|nr:glycosyltransferase family 4 protein [Rhodospirillaceae bacterium]MBT5566712.1 glycosyltransferase family 4 protein [Rhodospirillaceae bacterium]MBT6090763.1 glycosyltransferase family 4 protein [Rhodospirillaceae bacterium]